jgi:hypothetical protein
VEATLTKVGLSSKGGTSFALRLIITLNFSIFGYGAHSLLDYFNITVIPAKSVFSINSTGFLCNF